MEEKLSILIVEDEGIVAMNLEAMLLEEGYYVEAIVDDGKDALSIIENRPVDMVLLDVNINGEWDGIETAEQIKKIKNIPFIFLTAFSGNELVQRAKETGPSAFLVKPYQKQNLLIAIELAMYNFTNRKNNPELRQATSVSPFETSQLHHDPLMIFNDAIFVKQNYKFNKVKSDEIRYLEANGNHTNIYTVNSKYVIRQVIVFVLDKLNKPNFVRVHRSYVINIDFLTTFNTTSIFLGKDEIPIGRNYKDEFFGRFNVM